MLNIELKNQIKQYALENPNIEACGLILESGNSTFVCKCKNISQNSGKHFELNPLDYLRLWDEGRNKIIGYWHTQKSTKPSSLDVINYKNHKLPSYIYSRESDEIIEVTDKHLKYNKYLGREFEINKSDCFGLVRDYYKNEKGIFITDYHREDGWFKSFPDLIKNVYEREGFVKIKIEEIVEGDLVEFSYGHFGIYLEGDLILHHERSKYSNIERFTEVWKKRVSNIYRHI